MLYSQQESSWPLLAGAVAEPLKGQEELVGRAIKLEELLVVPRVHQGLQGSSIYSVGRRVLARDGEIYRKEPSYH